MINLASKILPIITILTININFNHLIIIIIIIINFILLHFIIPHLDYLNFISLFLKLIINLINYFHLQPPTTITLRNHPNLFILHLINQNPLHHLLHFHLLLNFILLLTLQFTNLLLLIIIPFF